MAPTLTQTLTIRGRLETLHLETLQQGGEAMIRVDQSVTSHGTRNRAEFGTFQ